MLLHSVCACVFGLIFTFYRLTVCRTTKVSRCCRRQTLGWESLVTTFECLKISSEIKKCRLAIIKGTFENHPVHLTLICKYKRDLTHAQSKCAPDASSFQLQNPGNEAHLRYPIMQLQVSTIRYFGFIELCHPNRHGEETGSYTLLLPTLSRVHWWQQFAITYPYSAADHCCCFRHKLLCFIWISYLQISACCSWRPQSSVHDDILMR